MTDIVLKTEGLTKHYGGVHALEAADFELRKGEHVAIMGDNGAGKSTFVRQLTAVEQRTSGRIMFNGQEVNFKTPLEAREAELETALARLKGDREALESEIAGPGASTVNVRAAVVAMLPARSDCAAVTVCSPSASGAGRIDHVPSATGAESVWAGAPVALAPA